jgi:hypothetical protein
LRKREREREGERERERRRAREREGEGERESERERERDPIYSKQKSLLVSSANISWLIIAEEFYFVRPDGRGDSHWVFRGSFEIRIHGMREECGATEC